MPAFAVAAEGTAGKLGLIAINSHDVDLSRAEEQIQIALAVRA